jgi:hypothetical protein
MNLGLLGAPEGTANLHRSEKTALAIERGAAGVVFVNNVEGHVLLTGTASINGSVDPHPGGLCFLGGWPAAAGAAGRGSTLRVRIRMTNDSSSV